MDTEQRHSRISQSSFAAVLLAGALYFVLSWACIELARVSGEGNVAFLWLPNAAGIALLVRHSPRLTPWLLLSMWIGNAVSNMIYGDHFPLVAALSGVNSMEMALASRLVKRQVGAIASSLTVSAALKILLVCCLLVSPLGAVMGAAAVVLMGGGDGASVLVNWWVGDVVGLLSIGLPCLAVTRREIMTWGQWRNFGVLMVGGILCAVTSLLALKYLVIPFVFMMLVPVLFALRYGATGTSILTISVSGSLAYILLSGSMTPVYFQADAKELLFVAALMNIFPYFVGLIADGMREREFRLERAEQLAQAKTVQLDNAKETLQTIIDHASAMIGYWDKHLHNHFASKSYGEWFGVAPERMCGMHIRDLLGEKLYQMNLPYITAALEGNTQVFERELVTLSGDRRNSLATYVPDIKNGQVNGFYVYVTDITPVVQARKAAMEAQAKLQGIFNATTEFSIIATDLEGTIQLFSQGAEKLLGYQASEMVGKQTPSILHVPDEVEKLAQALSVEKGHPVTGFDVLTDAANKGSADVREWTYVRKDGSRFPVSLVTTAIHNEFGKTTGYLGIAKDISAEIESREALFFAKQQAESANQAKSDFVAHVSHAVRTSVTSVLGMAQLLAKTELTEKQHKYVDLMQSSGKLLTSMLDDVLDLSRIEAGKIQFAPAQFDLDKVLAGVSSLMTSMVNERPVKFTVHRSPDVPVKLMGDGLRLQQLLNNLASNAIKFTTQGEIFVEASVVEKADSRIILRFFIRDTGMGFSKAQLEALFQPFAQIDDSLMHKADSGLGYVVAKRLAELMQGTLQVSSEPGKGSEFICLIPFDRIDSVEESASTFQSAANQSATAQSVKTNAPLQGLKILLVDDDKFGQAIGQIILEKLGASVVLLDDGEQAVNFLREPGRGVDLVLMDVQMPVKDGITATREIREKLKLDLPIVAVTAGAFIAERGQCIAAGMNDVIVKPLDSKNLLAVVRNQLPSKVKSTDASGFSDQRLEEGAHFRPDRFMTLLNGQGDNHKNAVATVRNALKSLPHTIEEARLALSEGRIQDAARIFHKLRGILSSLGAQTLVELCLTMESSLKTGDSLGLEPLFDALDKALTGMMTDARQWANLQL